MTRTTLKTLWFAGGGLLATWFAVTPANAPSTKLAADTAARSTESRRQIIDELSAQESKLRQHLEVLPLKPTARNPFRFADKPLAPAPRVSGRAAGDAPPPAAPTPLREPSLRLSGIAEQRSGQKTVRTAVLSGDGQLYLVGEGETVAGRYRVMTIDSDAVTLQDDAGGELRLALR
jgi:hypothetical protein